MGRATSLTARLPRLYRDGDIVGGINATWGAEIDLIDEAANGVQRAHWFDVTPDFDEAAALGALLGIPPEPFHASIGEYRAWVHALVDARLTAGAVTREGIRVLVDTYLDGFQRAAGLDLVAPLRKWDGELVEQPRRLVSARVPDAHSGWEPLGRHPVVNRGLDPAPWAVVLTGREGGEFAPMIANRTTGQAWVFRGHLPVGARLTLAPRPDDRSRWRADLEGVDVSDRIDAYPTLVPGPDGPGAPAPLAEAPQLARGANDLWFLPLAHYDVPGLDRFLLALAADELAQGRFDVTAYNESLFHQRAHVNAWVAWIESEPASFEVRLPAAVLRTRAEDTAAAVAAVARLETGLDAAVDRLAGVGVRADVLLTGHAERQPSRDRLRLILPIGLRDAGSTGADRLAESGGLFDVTDFDDSTLR